MEENVKETAVDTTGEELTEKKGKKKSKEEIIEINKNDKNKNKRYYLWTHL